MAHLKRLKRYGHKMICVFCGARAETADHLVPKSRGGPTTLENMRPCCLLCNQAKANLTPVEWLDDLCPDEYRSIKASPEFPPNPFMIRKARKPHSVATFLSRRLYHAVLAEMTEDLPKGPT